MKSLAFLCLVAASSAVDVYYYRNEWCGGTSVGGRTLACGRNQVPLSPSIGGFDLRYTNGIVVEFYDRRDCTGGPWFTDDGKGGLDLLKREKWLRRRAEGCFWSCNGTSFQDLLGIQQITKIRASEWKAGEHEYCREFSIGHAPAPPHQISQATYRDPTRHKAAGAQRLQASSPTAALSCTASFATTLSAHAATY
ncbi:hypothetical protein MHUMG1_04834 [Metarhizium humberi]|uniref:Uncharacterized protein n=1 Tax=Metarhizium humberi TaxID=2596975 RepID=A0A9P8MC35_9HYPO|nr:hypothetical protein MHUMG1_04834 [Metarhizium humberi]